MGYCCRGYFRYWVVALAWLCLVGCHDEQAVDAPSEATVTSELPTPVVTNTAPATEIVEAPDVPLSRGGPAAKVDVVDGPIRFADEATARGLHFVHRSGASGSFTYPEIMSGGVCLADLDRDGDLDIYLPQGGAIPGDEGEPGRNALFLNGGDGHFRNVSAASGADHPAYGMGAFAADVDRDGDLDLLLTNAGSLALLLNRGDATFDDATASAGLAKRDGFWLNAACGDLNGDGLLDVYIANYTLWYPGVDPQCKAPSGEPDYCNPTSYDGACDLLLFGHGDGTFEDATQSSGISAAATRSMGVLLFDPDRDGDQDIYVTNDGQANLLWINDGQGHFEDQALILGVALNAAGAAEASMGTAAGDFDADGDDDFLITHLEGETHTLYRNEGGFFVDDTARAGLAGWSRPDTGFGVCLGDFDLDGRDDLFVANGAVARPTRPRNPETPYAQPDRVARGDTNGRFPVAQVIANDQPGTHGSTPLVSRGAALGDVNGDGRVDLLVIAKDAPVRLLINRTQTGGHWIAFRPTSVAGYPSTIGTHITLLDQAQPRLGSVRPHGSYLGSSEDIVRFGLGEAKAPLAVQVTWPDQTREQFFTLAVDQLHELVRGTGAAVSETSVEPLGRSDSTNITSSESETRVREPMPEAGSEPLPVIAPEQLGPLPPIRFEPQEPVGFTVRLDDSQLASWCRQAGLPPPPERSGLDSATWKLVHPAIEAAARRPSAETLGALAMYYDGHRVSESARELYERVVKMAPYDAQWWHLLGRVEYELGRIDESVQAFERATVLAPRSAEGWGRLAESQLAAGQAAEAAAAWQKYTALRPADPIGFIGLARAFESLGDFAAARREAEQALQKQPQARPALVLAARVAARSGDAEAAASFRQSADQLTAADDPIMADAVDLGMREHARTLGFLRTAVEYYKSHQQYAEAYRTALLLAERRPEEAQNWQLLTWLAVALRQNQDAARHGKTALALNPQFAAGHEAIARGYIEARENAQALAAIERALTVDPEFTHALVTRGIVRAGMGQWTAAQDDLEKGLAAHPDDVEGWIMLTVSRANTGNLAGARSGPTRLEAGS